MQIRTKFVLNTTLVLSLVVFIGIVERVQFQREQVNQAHQELLTSLARSVYDFNFITHDYFKEPTERSRTQWLLKYDSLSAVWAEIKQQIDIEQESLDKIDTHFIEATVLFKKLGENTPNPGLTSSATNEELRNRLAAQLLIRARSLYGETVQLSKAISFRATQEVQQERNWQFGGLLLLVLMSTGMTFIVWRSLFPRLKRVQNAFSQLAEGRLDYRLNDPGVDELSSLATSFNRTVARLAEITVSRQSLEDEIEIRKSSQSRLQQVEKALVATSDSVFMFFAGNGQIFYVNKGASTTLGEDRQDLLTLDIKAFFPQLEQTLAPATKTTPEKKSWSVLELEVVRPNGGTLHMEASLQYLANKGAEGSSYYILIARDISERKALEQQQKALNQELERRVKERTLELELTNKELEAFSYSISHDLRAPLRAINGQAGMLEDELEPGITEKSRHHLKAIRHNSLQMGQLVDDLLAYSRLSKGANNYEQVDLESLTKSCWQETQQRTGAHEIDFQLHSLPPCHGDAVMLKQAMLNLLDNAVKYSAGKGPVSIEVGSTRKDETDIYFVRDNGVGFDMRYADKMFDVFHRLHSQEAFDGTGIGLSLVKRIIERHNGQIWAEGEVNKGATFFFTLNEVNTR